MTSIDYKKHYFELAEQGPLSEFIRLIKTYPDLLNEKISFGQGKDKYTASAIHLAAARGHLDIVSHLIQQGIKPTSLDSLGNSILHAAAANGHTKLVKDLVQNSTIGINAKNKAGWTPLHMAARYGHTEIVSILLENDTLHLEDYEGRTPVDIANQHRYPRTTEMLIQHYQLTDKLPPLQPTYRNLVLEGGGVKGIGHIGALKQLRQANDRMNLANIDNVMGTSAGAIVSAYLACGASLEDIEQEAFTELTELKDTSEFYKGGIFADIKRVFSDYGFYKGNTLRARIAKLVKLTLGSPNATFADLHQAVINQAPVAKDSPQRYRDLYVVGANISTGFEEVFSYETTPDMPIADAIRISASIPVFFKAIRAKKDAHGQFILNEDGSLKTDYPSDSDAHVYGDGGIFNNYFISYFDENGPNSETLGIKTKTRESIDALLKDKMPKGEKTKNIIQYLVRLIGTMANQKNEYRHQSKANNARTIFIETDTNAIDFAIEKGEIEALIQAGSDAVDAFMARKSQHYPTNPLDYQDDKQQRLDLQKEILEGLYTIPAARHFDYQDNRGIIQLELDAKTPSDSKLIGKLKKLQDSDHILTYHLVKKEGKRLLEIHLDSLLISHLMDCCDEEELTFDSKLASIQNNETLFSYQTQKPSPREKGKHLLTLIHSKANIEDIEKALKEGVPLEYHDKNGNTALHLAVKQQNHYLVNLLLRYGAQQILDFKNSHGQSALHIAAASDDIMVGILLLHQASINTRDKNGQTPFELAKKNDMHRATNLLTPKGGISDESNLNKSTIVAPTNQQYSFFSKQSSIPKPKHLGDKVVTKQRVLQLIDSTNIPPEQWNISHHEQLMLVSLKPEGMTRSSKALLQELQTKLATKQITKTTLLNDSTLLINLQPIYRLSQTITP